MAFEMRHVGDTALMVAAARASETARRDGLVQDPYAARLAGERGMGMARHAKQSRWMSFGIGLRSRFIDEFLLAELKDGSIDCVLSLGAGLDARPWRLALPDGLRWIEVDFQPILDYKRDALKDVPASCRLERLIADLNEEDERRRPMDEATTNSSQVLLLTEGLLYYLPASTVRGLAAEAAARSGFSSWVLDVSSQALMRLHATGATSIEKFGHETRLDGEQILETVADSGWTAAGRKTFVKDGAALAIARAKENGWTSDPNVPRPSVDDPAGVWLFRRKA